MPRPPRVRGLIGWFATTPVAANLLMAFIVLGGIYSIIVVKKESFPPFQFDQINVRVSYPGAGPEEVEQGIVIKIEEAVNAIEGIRKVTGLALEGSGRVTIEVVQGYDIGDIMDEVKLAIDELDRLPAMFQQIGLPGRADGKPQRERLGRGVRAEVV